MCIRDRTATTLAAWSQTPPAFHPNAGTLLNIFARPVEGPTLPASALPLPADEKPAGDMAQGSVKVSRFVIEGVSLLPPAEVEAQLAELVGRDATLNDLRLGAARITSLYLSLIHI